MIDWTKPLRLKKNGRQVYANGYLNDGTWNKGRIVGPDPRFNSGGIPYNNKGEPLQECPWGAIENFDPLEELGAGSWQDVANPAERREQRQLQESIEDNPLFGAW